MSKIVPPFDRKAFWQRGRRVSVHATAAIIVVASVTARGFADSLEFEPQANKNYTPHVSPVRENHELPSIVPPGLFANTFSVTAGAPSHAAFKNDDVVANFELSVARKIRPSRAFVPAVHRPRGIKIAVHQHGDAMTNGNVIRSDLPLIGNPGIRGDVVQTLGDIADHLADAGARIDGSRRMPEGRDVVVTLPGETSLSDSRATQRLTEFNRNVNFHRKRGISLSRLKRSPFVPVVIGQLLAFSGLSTIAYKLIQLGYVTGNLNISMAMLLGFRSLLDLDVVILIYLLFETAYSWYIESLLPPRKP